MRNPVSSDTRSPAQTCPHVHGIVPGGGLAPDGKSWIACRPGFFLSVRVLYLVHKVVLLLVTLLKPAAHLLPPGHWFGVAAIDLAALLLLTLALLGMGVFSRSKAGRHVAETLERLVLSKVPGYLMIKSIAADFSSGEYDEGLQPVLVSFDDNQVLGFMIEKDYAGDRVTVFLPGSPSPAGGNVVVVPGARVQLLDASLGQTGRAMKQRGLGLLQLTMVPASTSRSASGPL